MFQPDPATTALLTKLNANYRFRCLAPEQRQISENPPQFTPTGQPVWVAEVIDLTTKEPYAEGRGADKASALQEAVKAAVGAPKPMTPAQKATLGDAAKEMAKLRESVGSKDAEIEGLRAQVEDLHQRLAGTKRGTKTSGRITPQDGLPAHLVGAEAV